VFGGEFAHNLDGKNRVVLPAAFRKEMSPEELEKDGLVMTIGRDAKCLNLETKKSWEARIEKFLSTHDIIDDEESEDELRDITSSKRDLEVDRQFRFVLPGESRRAVGIDKKESKDEDGAQDKKKDAAREKGGDAEKPQKRVVFVGMVTRIEVWDKAHYDEYKKERDEKKKQRQLEKQRQKQQNT